MGLSVDFLDFFIELMVWKSRYCGNTGIASRPSFSTFRARLGGLDKFAAPQVGRAQVAMKRTWRDTSS